MRASAKFTRAAFKYAMRSSRARRGRPTTGVRCRITTAAATRARPFETTTGRRFRIQSAEFMRASQLDTRPVLFHGNVITRGAGSRGYEPRSSVYNRGLIRLTGCPSNRRQRGVIPAGKSRGGTWLLRLSSLVLSRQNTEIARVASTDGCLFGRSLVEGTIGRG